MVKNVHPLLDFYLNFVYDAWENPLGKYHSSSAMMAIFLVCGSLDKYTRPGLLRKSSWKQTSCSPLFSQKDCNVHSRHSWHLDDFELIYDMPNLHQCPRCDPWCSLISSASAVKLYSHLYCNNMEFLSNIFRPKTHQKGRSDEALSNLL